MRQGYLENEIIRDAGGRAVDFRTLVVNPQFERLTGIPANEAVGRTARELVGELDPAWIETYDRVVRTGQPEQFEREEPAFGRWFEVQAYPLTGDRFAILYDDITKRRRTNAALRESETRHRNLIGSWAQAVWETDPDGVVVADSPSWRAYTGQTFDEWRGYGWLDAVHPDDRAYAERQWREAVAVRGLVDAEFRLRSPEGGWHWTNVRATPLLDADGEIEKWVGMNIDIDARKRAEEALRDSEELRRIALQGGGMGPWKWDTRNRTVQADSPYQRWGMAPSNQTHSVSLYASVMGSAGKAFLETVMAKEIAPGELFEDQVQLTSGPNAGRWLQWRGRADRDKPWIINGVSFDITEQKSLEQKLRESEERQAFLLKLTDALRPLTSPIEAQKVATHMLGEEMQVDRCYYAEFDWPHDVLYINQEYVRAPSFSVIGEHPISAFQDLLQFSHKGEPLICDNIATHPIFKSEEAAYRERGTDGFVLVPQLRGGVMAACICVTMTVPRSWTQAEVDLVREVGDRTWDASQRVRAESAVRESEERFRQFANASAGALWIRDAKTLSMEYASPAIAEIYGTGADALLGDVKHWAAMIVPEERDNVFKELELARRGEAVVHEFRIQRFDDGTFRWIRDTNFPLYDSHGHVQRIGGIFEDVTEARMAAQHQAVLLSELQHRVRNIMAMIRSVTARTGELAGSVADYASLMAGRLLALARVQTLLTRAANAGVSIAAIVHDEIAAAAAHDGQFDASGPEIVLSPKASEVITLALHELATNALKYGALAGEGGHIAVTWETFDRLGTPWLRLDWNERGAPGIERPDGARRRGFGSELIEGRIPYELSGRGVIEIVDGNARCHLEFPLRDAPSILETDAPARATIFGGAIDMTGEARLEGHRVLVVEDDFYLATDTARALRGAGADILGPCPNEAAARDEMKTATPTSAVVDINLGEGPSFDLARDLKKAGIPFVFVTGYDAIAIPEEFNDVKRLQKPVELRQIVGAVARSSGAGSQTGGN